MGFPSHEVKEEARVQDWDLGAIVLHKQLRISRLLHGGSACNNMSSKEENHRVQVKEARRSSITQQVLVRDITL